MWKFRLYDDNGVLVYLGYNWEYTRRYLDYLVRTLPDSPRLEIHYVSAKFVPSPV